MAIPTFRKFFIVSARTGVHAVRILYGQGGGGQFFAIFADVFYGQALMKLCTAKMFFGQEHHFKMTSYRRQAGLDFSSRQKSEGEITQCSLRLRFAL